MSNNKSVFILFFIIVVVYSIDRVCLLFASTISINKTATTHKCNVCYRAAERINNVLCMYVLISFDWNVIYLWDSVWSVNSQRYFVDRAISSCINCVQSLMIFRLLKSNFVVMEFHLLRFCVCHGIRVDRRNIFLTKDGRKTTQSLPNLCKSGKRNCCCHRRSLLESINAAINDLYANHANVRIQSGSILPPKFRSIFDIVCVRLDSVQR